MRIFERVKQFLAGKQIVSLRCGCAFEVRDSKEYIQHTILQAGQYEPTITRIITQFLTPTDIFIDIGANVGYHSLVAAMTGARVHAFEPVPRLANHFRRNVELNDLGSEITINQLAVGDAASEAPIYLAARIDDGSHSFIKGVPAKSITAVPVQLTRLDDYCKIARISPRMIKIDVEGYEARVLDGATELLTGPSRPVWIFETGDRLSDQIGESARSVLERFWSSDYSVFLLPDDADSRLPAVIPSEISGELNNYLALPSDATRRQLFESLLPND